jgi:micrococcal nuclease
MGGVLFAGLALAVLSCVAVPSSEQGPSAVASSTSVVSPTALERVGPTGPTEIARVARITDGDTVRVIIDGVEHRLRYIGIDTPESVAPDSPIEPFALAASDANAMLVERADVVLESDVSDTDRYDRLLRYVWLAPETPGGAWRLVNLELVEAGLAEAVEYPPDTKYADDLEAAEQEARQAGRGMWER